MNDDSPSQIKWHAHYQEQHNSRPQPCYVLSEYQHLLPQQGKALDLACGRGGNAILLAGKGLQVSAWDYAESAIKSLTMTAQNLQLAINVEQRDIEKLPPEAESFDVIVVSHFLDRDLMPFISAALKPNGLVFYQTFTREKVNESGPRNPLYRLEAGELYALFSNLRLMVYREEACQGDVSQGFRNEALLVAQKR